MLTMAGILLVAIGMIVSTACLAGRSNDRLLERHVRQQQRLRRAARLRPVDLDGHRRVLRAALAVGALVGAVTAAVGILVLG
jgi:hypothetical protein